ncbi:uncharacterized protein LOC135467902 isoform X2 [Liolophura sinensis]|uniref:uncharacterized protein LOC135467902 isoform X2 n=1 Tax=Liolophura sinensis TaxID=3198878 RepID=UPI003158FB6D
MSGDEDDMVSRTHPNERLNDSDATVTDIEHREAKPKHVSANLWEKFKALEKRTDEVTRRSTERRMKLLRNDITLKVQEHLDLDSHGSGTGHAVLPGSGGHSELSDSARYSSSKTVSKKITNTSGVTDITRSQPTQWDDVRKHLAIDYPAEDKSRGGKTRLELQIETALNKGDYSLADQLSDQLANRQFGEKIAHGFDARRRSKA